MDASPAARAERLRRIAAVEIARHRETEGFLGAALDGSLATGTVWPSSDLDFTVVPLPGAERQEGVAWGEREGIPWHKHFNSRPLILELIAGYPESFIQRAEGRFNLDANWLLDGLAVMEVVEDPEGLLAEAREFVRPRRFAAEVWEGRRAALLQELRRQRDAAQRALDTGDAETACQQLTGRAGFSPVAGHLWLESAHLVYSDKEQDGHVAAVTREAGYPEAHALYRRAGGVDAARAQQAAPLILELGSRAGDFFHVVAGLPVDPESGYARSLVWEAWVRHLSETLYLAPGRGHPAHVFQCLPMLRYWTVASPEETAKELREQEILGAEALAPFIPELTRLGEAVTATLLGPTPPAGRAAACLAAADRLLALTERAL